VHCFRLHKGRVYYVSEASMRLSISVARPNLVSLGTCLGKFSKSGKFKLHITSLDYLAQYAKYKVSLVPPPFKLHCSNDHDEVWVKPNGEMPFLYGNHVLKAHLGRITEDTPEHQGVVVYSMNDVPLVINWLCVLYNLSSSVTARSGIRSYVQVNSGYAKNGPDSHRRFSSSVRIRKVFSLPSAHAFSFPRDVGEYLRDEVNRFSAAIVQQLKL
jgi:ribosome biogenesis protein Nip4